MKDKNYILTFGKHKGKSLGELLSLSPSYLIWLHFNTNIQLTDKLMSLAMFNHDNNVSDDNPSNEHFSHDIYEFGDH